MLNFISDWCSKWRMVVNTEKTQVVPFHPTRKTPTPFEFRFGNNTLLRVPEYKYLVVYLDEHVSFKGTATVLAEGASRALGAIRYRLKFLKECRTATFTKLFSSCVCPILDYASGVWGTKQFDVLERVQERAMRYFLGVPRFTPKSMLNGDMGWSSCYARHNLVFGCGIDLCPYHPPELQIRFSSGIYHTPRDLALGHILLRNCLSIWMCRLFLNANFLVILKLRTTVYFISRCLGRKALLKTQVALL